MKQVILFLMTFAAIYLFYLFFAVRKVGKKNKKGIVKKIPVETQYIIYKYKLKVESLNLKKLVNIVCLATSFSMSVAISFISLIENIYLQLLVGLLIVVPLTVIFYDIIGKHYQKEKK